MTNKKKILLIDDDTNLLITLSDFLAFEDYDVTTADSGEEGLKKLKSLHPDLIILDMSMPGMGGIGFLKEISLANGKPRYPVLVLTARANMAEFFANVSVDGFIAKPCDPNDLLMEVGRIIFLRSGGDDDKVEGKNRNVKKTVLIAEDDGGVRTRLVDVFSGAGYIVDSVAKGPEVLEKAIVQQPDVIVMKLVLSRMNGDAVAQMLKEMPNTSSIPIVLYDNSSSAAGESKFTQAGTGIKQFVRSDDSKSLLAAVEKVTG